MNEAEQPEDLDYIAVASVDQVPRKGGKKIILNGRKIALFKVDGEIFAIQNSCPHQGADLAGGFVHQGKVHCPLHGWKFDVRSGAYDFNEMMKLRTYPVKVVDDQVYVAWMP
jgi:NAD(P)H-dependent nitrite reductase small subunit